MELLLPASASRRLVRSLGVQGTITIVVVDLIERNLKKIVDFFKIGRLNSTPKGFKNLKYLYSHGLKAVKVAIFVRQVPR